MLSQFVMDVRKFLREKYFWWEKCAILQDYVTISCYFVYFFSLPNMGKTPFRSRETLIRTSHCTEKDQQYNRQSCKWIYLRWKGLSYDYMLIRPIYAQTWRHHFDLFLCSLVFVGVYHRYVRWLFIRIRGNSVCHWAVSNRSKIYMSLDLWLYYCSYLSRKQSMNYFFPHNSPSGVHCATLGCFQYKADVRQEKSVKNLPHCQTL